VRLVATIPSGWTVAATGGGAVDPFSDSVTWAMGDVQADAQLAATMRLRAPLRSPADRPAWDAVFAGRLEHADGILDTASVRLRVAPEIIVEHATFARVDDVSQVPTYLWPDESLGGLGQLELFRIRFQVRNADLLSTVLTPGLQYRLAGAIDFADVPTVGPVEDMPFYLGTEWRPVAGGEGTLPGPDEELIPGSALREHDRDDDTQEPVGGRRMMQSSSARAFGLAGDSYSELEFTVKSSLALPFNQDFEFRLVDGGRPLQGAVIAVVRSGPQPPIILSPGQQDGIPVGPPVDASRLPLGEVDFPLVTPGYVAAAWPEINAVPIYRLAIAVPTAPLTQYPLAADTYTSPHGPDVSLVSDTCAACHRSHTARTGYLLSTDAPQEALCFTCHGTSGLGSSSNVEAQYAAVPANVPDAREYYRHDVVANVNLECTSCHNPHNATAVASTQTTTGWTVAGAQGAVAGTVVTNGAAGSTPSYTYQDGTFGHQPTREYEICFRCHTGSVVASNTGQPPSRYQLDKGVELNFNNASYHPVEKAGNNRTTAMIDSLAGVSPYKLWDFTIDSTVRCVNCHGDPGKFSLSAKPAPGSDLAPHASQYRGILIQNYQDRVLQTHGEEYIGDNQAADFALCYVCHAEEPFTNADSAATNFPYHQLHVSGIAGEGDGSTDIDAASAGQGNAICAECHFRIHGTALANNVGDRSNSRLVNFAPNVMDFSSGTAVGFTPKPVGGGRGSCTLTCHGERHDALPY
jgi:predicted CXXCH cytochrome family protein